jgi:hypothetical protein
LSLFGTILFSDRKGKKFMKLNNKGFSLMEVVAASGVVSIISISTAMLITQSQSVANYGEFVQALDQRHNISIQKIKNVQNLADKLGIGGLITTDSCYKKGSGKLVSDCDTNTAHKGTASPQHMLPLFAGESASDYNGTTADGLMDYTMTYEIICVPTACKEIRIRVTTRPSAAAETRGLFAKTRQTDIVIPTTFLADKSQMRFACGATQVITQIDYDRQDTFCTGYVGPNTCGTTPINGAGGGAADCKAIPTPSPCGKGVRVTGFFGAQASCN